MRYDYACDKCKLTWIENHGMNENPTIKCPKCKRNAYMTFKSVPAAYVRGYGWLDKAGRRRDMNLHKLINDDPYKKYREPGEKSELASRLKKGGRHNPKAKHFNLGK